MRTHDATVRALLQELAGVQKPRHGAGANHRRGDEHVGMGLVVQEQRHLLATVHRHDAAGDVQNPAAASEGLEEGGIPQGPGLRPALDGLPGEDAAVPEVVPQPFIPTPSPERDGGLDLVWVQRQRVVPERRLIALHLAQQLLVRAAAHVGGNGSPPGGATDDLGQQVPAQQLLHHPEVLEGHGSPAGQTQRGAAQGTHRELRETLGSGQEVLVVCVVGLAHLLPQIL
mmetsp:Transcript_78848/g.189242  ORF Transcript_78848/g.189242 Transcript_78848/m.189242 type:complete len:228 (-) Transcript_78848:663-1346(-)